MSREYGNLVDLKVELDQYGGYLDTQGIKEMNELRGKYAAAVNGFVYTLLKDGMSSTEAAAAVNTDLDEIAAASDDGWHQTYEEIRSDLIARIEGEAGKKPWQRTLRHRLPLIAGGLLVVCYFGVALYCAIPVDQPFATAAGLKQRAAALEKTLRYDDWASTHTRRGGLIKGLLLWPIEPNEQELKGASELGGLIFGAGDELQKAGTACAVPLPNTEGPFSAATLELLSDVATHLRDPGTRWRTPPVATVIDPIQTRYPCKSGTEVTFR